MPVRGSGRWRNAVECAGRNSATHVAWSAQSVDGVVLDAFVVMPNHVHGIIMIVGAGSKPASPEFAPPEPAPPSTSAKRQGLPEIVRQFKTFSARWINEYRGTPGVSVWQRNNYYEHIIRNQESLYSIREYIVHNPLRWQVDW